MAPGLMLIVGAIYLFIAIDMLRIGNFGLALTFGAFSLSNVGLWMVAIK
jgi:hypothetical protein